MIDINGRNPVTKLHYKEINQKLDESFGKGLGGRVQEIKDFKWLYKHQKYDVPLYPQRTVVQFNSTYMELTGRQDRIRGDVTSGSFFFLTIFTIGIYYTTLSILLDLSKNNFISVAYVGFILFVFVLMAIYLM